MSTDEKLAEIANLIENMLKKNGKFITVNYSTVCFDYVNEDIVKTYRHPDIHLRSRLKNGLFIPKIRKLF